MYIYYINGYLHFIEYCLFIHILAIHVTVRHYTSGSNSTEVVVKASN